MAGDEEKKKKKKTKKAAAAAEEAPAPPPEPAPEPEPAPAPPAGGDDNDDWLSAATEDTPAAAGGGSDEAAPEEAPAQEEGAPPAEGDEGELPPQPKPKPKYFVHWDRRKAKFYDYNFEYGANYYKSMVNYVDKRNAAFSSGAASDVPRRMAFAERGMYSTLERSLTPDVKTEKLLSDVRNSIRNFEHSQKVYAYGKK